MKPRNRKLQIQDNDASFQFQNPNSSSSTPPFKKPASMPPPQSTTPPQQQQQQYSNQPFDSSMALTILVLLTALFFMGFFSICMRRFSIDPSEEFSSHSRRRRYPPPTTPGRPPRPTPSTRRGVDPEIVKSLPVYAYYHGDAKYQMECAICLGEFEEKETVKLIPNCEHVFHLDCIDTWLKMHMTCPVCRGTKFPEVNSDHGGDYRGRQERVDHGRSVVENGDAILEVRELGTEGVSRSIGCSSFGERMLLQGASSL